MPVEWERAPSSKEIGNMVRKSEEKQVVTKPAPFNGVGEITVRSLLNGRRK